MHRQAYSTLTALCNACEPNHLVPAFVEGCISRIVASCSCVNYSMYIKYSPNGKYHWKMACYIQGLNPDRMRHTAGKTLARFSLNVYKLQSGDIYSNLKSFLALLSFFSLVYFARYKNVHLLYLCTKHWSRKRIVSPY